MTNPHSTAKISGHPIHAMLVPFPIALFVSACACDLAFWQTGNVLWTTGALWLIGAYLVTATLTAIAGLTDFAGEPRIRNLKAAWLHAGGNIFAVLLELYNFYIRYGGGTDPVLYLGLGLSVTVAAILLFTGRQDWEMVYRHRIGIEDSDA